MVILDRVFGKGKQLKHKKIKTDYYAIHKKYIKQAQLRAAADRLGHSNRGSVMIVIRK